MQGCIPKESQTKRGEWKQKVGKRAKEKKKDKKKQSEGVMYGAGLSRIVGFIITC